MSDPDEHGRWFPNYDVVLRRNADGIERTYHMDSEWDHSGDFWWSEGNGACDCNRAMIFDRLGGMDEDQIMDTDYSCGSERYTVVRYIFPDGTSEEVIES